ncbi:hypothetical protein GCM10010510_26640 [Streptomyces anandii JCM 4720]|nr:hypothetical protein GCM10010510_26640 [Streptomyces anandii JCM 4720]
MVVVLDEEQSHPGPLRFSRRMVTICTKRVHARVHQGSHADGRGRRQEGSGCVPPVVTQPVRTSHDSLPHVSGRYRIVMLRSPSDVMTLVEGRGYGPPKPEEDGACKR